MNPSPAGGIADQIGLVGIKITFSEPITFASDPVLAWGVVSGPIPLESSYNADLHELSVVLTSAVQGDRVTLYVLPTIVDLAGQPLDGEFVSPLLAQGSSGDGFPGGIATLRFDVLQGDANGDGATNSIDAQLVLAALGSCVGELGFDVRADLDADGCVAVTDVQILLSGLGGMLPALDHTPPVIESLSRASGAPLSEDLSELVVTFGEPLSPLSVVPGIISVRSLEGALHLPNSTLLRRDGIAIECHFDPPLSSCGNYTVEISNAVADASGELFVPPPVPPAFSGSAPPASPVLDRYTPITSAAGVTLSGILPSKPGFAQAAQVRVQGPDQVMVVPASGSFQLTMQLDANEINYLYVSAISPCGIASAPVVAEVTRDNAPPSLTIQFPSDSRIAAGKFFEAAINVGGTVADTLSGFEGMSVTVNGVSAAVDIGIGQNGTWVAENVPLNAPGVPTELVVVATDVVGNASTTSIVVTRAEIARGEAFVEALSGDDQVSVVNAVVPRPAMVKVWKPDGTPWANKVVDFRVTQNDGRLSNAGAGAGFGNDTMFCQVVTNASGEAAVSWRLGGTAGCGNNRVEAAAKDVAGVALFTATAFAAQPDQINVGSGNSQRVETGGLAPLPLRAWINDSCNPVAEVPVTFTVTQGDGLVNGLPQVTVPSGITGHAEVTFLAGVTPGANRVEATFPGNKTNPAVFVTYGVARDYSKPTSFRGVVLDNASRPIGHVGISLKFQDAIVASAFTNDQGQFEFSDLAHDGAVHVIVQGAFANKLNGAPMPPGVKFPPLGYDTTIVPNAENSLGRPILLPPMLAQNSVLWNGQSDVTLECEGIDGLKLHIKKGSMTLANGSKPSVNAPVQLSLNQVHHDDIPMPIPDGAAPSLALTLQPAQATFDPPIAIEYPNVAALPPGASAYFMSFDHDLGEFAIVGAASVTGDGSLIKTLPNQGLTISGWHCNCPPYSVTGECKQCRKLDFWQLAKQGAKLIAELAIAFGKVGNWIECAYGVVSTADQVRDAYDEVKSDGVLSKEEQVILLSLVSSAKSAVVSCAVALSVLPDPAVWSEKALAFSDAIGAAIAAAQDSGCFDGASAQAALQVAAVIQSWASKFLSLGENLSLANALLAVACGTIDQIAALIALDNSAGGGPSWEELDKLFAALDSQVESTFIVLPEIAAPLAEQPIVQAAGETLEELDELAPARPELAGFAIQIGGQSVIADEDGAFEAANISAPDLWGPGGPGTLPDFVADDPIQIVGYGTVEGEARYVYAAPLLISQGDIAIPEAVQVSSIPPSGPSLLELEAATEVLSTGMSTPLTVTAIMNSGASEDFTAAASGTRYRTSNPAIATVSAEGILTGQAPGTVFITAINSSATAVKRIDVTSELVSVALAGRVRLVSGVGVAGTKLSSTFGGSVVSGRDGSFILPVLVPIRAGSIGLQAQAEIDGQPFVGGATLQLGGVSGLLDAGEILLVPFSQATLYGPSQLAVGDTPLAVRLVDLNGDGRLDIVTANAGSGDITVRFATDDGAFSDATFLAMGQAPRSVEVADVNGDGWLDLITAGDSGGLIRLGDGRGSFGVPEEIDLGPSPHTIVVADLDGDRDADLAASNPASNAVTLRLNQGGGRWSRGESLPFGLSPERLLAVDIDADGDLDLIASNFDSDQVSIRRNRGAATFGAIEAWPMGDGTTDVIAIDANGDAETDLVASNFWSGDITMRMGLGKGAFGSVIALPSGEGASALAAADLDLDGDVDIVAIHLLAGTIGVHWNDGKGGFAAAELEPAGASPSSLAVADLDKDGFPDIVVTNAITASVTVIPGKRRGALGAVELVDANGTCVDVSAADVNDDGRTDLVTANGAEDGVSVVLALEAGGFAPHAILVMGESPTRVVLADVGADGAIDILSVHPYLNAVVLRKRLPSGWSEPSTIVMGSAPVDLACVDVNGDDLRDLITANADADEVTLRVGAANGTFGPALFTSVGDGPRALATGDLDGDGDIDVALACYWSKQLWMLWNDGGSFTSSTAPLSIRPDAIAIGDLNGDGILDLAFASSGADRIGVMYGLGARAFASSVDVATARGPRSIVVRDLDGDGDSDLVAACGEAGVIAAHLTAIDGTFDAFWTFVTGPGSDSIAVLPGTSPGRPDLCSAIGPLKSVAILRQSFAP